MRQSSQKVIITCAVTGNLTTPEMTPHLPITPRQIADACLGAADEGAAIAHIHVRDPATGRPSMALEHYQETVALIRATNSDLILNITTGPGGRFVPSTDDPKIYAPGTTLMNPEKRVEHIVALRPDICTLDLNTMNSGKEVVINTPGNVARMAKVMMDAGVKPEIELFDSGDIALMHDIIKDGAVTIPVMTSIVMGVKYGFQPSPETVLYARNLLPANSQFTAFGIGRWSFPMVAQSYLMGGHVRVGMEDAVYLDRGVLAKRNGEMVAKARRIVTELGGAIASVKEARAMLGLPERARDLAKAA